MNMKIYFLLIGICFLSCGTRESLFEVNSETEFRIELGLSIIETHKYVRSNVRIPVRQTIDNLGFMPDDISEVLPLRAVLEPKFGDNVNLDFINGVNIFIIDPELLRPREIFYFDLIPFGQKTEIELLPTLTDISDLLQNDQAIIEVSIDLRQFPPSSFDMEVRMQFSGYASE